MSISQGTMFIEGFGDVAFTHTTLVAPKTTSSIAVKFNAPKHSGECGVIKGRLLFPFFRMGCCGVESMVVKTHTLSAPKQINKDFFKKIAKLLEMTPYFDWDWSSFRRNIITPNKEHITEIFGEFFANRIERDLYVVLNNWDNITKEDEKEAREAGIILLSHKTYFTEKDVDY